MTVSPARSSRSAQPEHLASNPLLSRWVAVGQDGVVEVRVGKVELGQGILTALAQLAADELGVGLGRVRMVPADTACSPDEGITSGSLSIATSGPALRAACANVRALFLAEAARRWGSGIDGVVVSDGVFRTEDGSRRATYAELADSVDLEVEADPELVTTPVQARVVGTSAARIDLPAKIAGRPVYIADLRLPGQMYGRVVRPPSRAARLTGVDESVLGPSTALVVRDGSFLGVVGSDETRVARAAETLRDACTWQEEASLPDEDDLAGFLKAGPHETTTVAADPEGPLGSGRRLRAAYSRPFLAHASLAPSCAIALWESDGRVRVWSHTQGVFRLRDAIAQALGLGRRLVSVQHVENAGCYGHNGADDVAFDAVLLARAVPGRPVQVQWSRRDELSWAPLASAMLAEVEATLDDSGMIRSWTYDVWSQGHTARPGYAGAPGLLAAAHLAEARTFPPAVDPPQPTGGTTRNALPGYAVGTRRITGHRLVQTRIRSSAMRALGAFLNVFAIESFLDELAAHAGYDPLEYRFAHLHDDRARHVLRTAAEAANWGAPTPETVGRGIGFARYKGSGAYCAVVAEVEAEHEVRVRRLTVVVDAGRVVNPDGLRNQIEGGATQATSWTLKERVRFDALRVTSDDWESYPILRFSEAPEIGVEIVDRPDLPSVGAGEAAQGPTGAAIANALTDAIGVRVRNLPLTTEAVVAAIESG